MPSHSLSEHPLFPIPRALRRLSGKSWAWSLAVLAFIALLPDLALALAGQLAHAVWFVIHTVIGVLELSIECLVEWAFHTSRHTAQLITAWILLLLFVLLLVWVTRRWLLPALRAPASDDDTAPR